MTSVDDALQQLADQWDMLNWDFRPLDVGAGVEKVSQWQGNAHDAVMVVVFKGTSISEPFHRQDFFFLDYAYRNGYDALSADESNLISIREGDCYIGQPYSGYALRGESEGDDIVMVGVHIKREAFFREYLPVFSTHPRMFRFFLEPQKDRFSDKFIHVSLAGEPRMRALIELMVTEYTQNGPDTQGILKLLLRAVFMYAARVYRAQAAEEVSPKDRIVEYIGAHCESVTLGEVAERFSYHPNYVSTMLHKEYEVTFSELVLRSRMERASALLGATTLTNEEVAAMVGYGNTSNFYKAFRRYWGVTPADMRDGQQSGAYRRTEDLPR